MNVGIEMFQKIMASELSLGVCRIIAAGRGAGMRFSLLYRMLRMTRKDMAIKILLYSRLITAVLALVLERSRVFCLDVLMDGRDILDGSDIVTVWALDGGFGTDVREPGFYSSHGRLWLGRAAAFNFF